MSRFFVWIRSLLLLASGGAVERGGDLSGDDWDGSLRFGVCAVVNSRWGHSKGSGCVGESRGHV